MAVCRFMHDGTALAVLFCLRISAHASRFRQMSRNIRSVAYCSGKYLLLS